MSSIMSLLCVLLCALLLSATAAAPPPIVFVPGLSASSIFVNTTANPPAGCPPNLTFGQLWPPSSLFTTQYPICGQLLGEIHYNATTHQYVVPPGTTSFVRDFGGFSSVMYFDPNTFANWGYKPGSTILGAPYDWRMAPDNMAGFYTSLRNLVQEVANNTKSKVVLMAVSNGPMATLGFLYAMNAQWKQKYLCGFAPSSPVWGGTPWPVGVALTGTGAWGGLSPSQARILSNTWPSSMWNMPRYGTTPGTFNDSVVFVYSPTKNYTANSFDKLLIDMGFNDSAVLWEKVRGVTSASFPDPGINVVVTYGTGIGTINAFYVGNLTKDPNVTPTITRTTSVSGDGMVTDDSSLRANASWHATMAQKKLNFTYIPYNGMHHANCYTNPQCVQDTMKAILSWDCTYSDDD